MFNVLCHLSKWHDCPLLIMYFLYQSITVPDHAWSFSFWHTFSVATFVVEWTHSYAPKSSGKPLQESRAYHNSKVEINPEWDIQEAYECADILAV